MGYVSTGGAAFDWGIEAGRWGAAFDWGIEAGGAGAGAGGGITLISFTGSLAASFTSSTSIFGIGTVTWATFCSTCSISINLSTFPFEVGVGGLELSSEIPSPTVPAPLATSVVALLVLLLSLDLSLDELLLVLLLPLSPLLPGRITTSPEMVPPPRSGACIVMICSFSIISAGFFLDFLSFWKVAVAGVLGVEVCDSDLLLLVDVDADAEEW
jgi:hypothetical protein